MEIESIRIDQIDTAGRLRKADPKQVQAIADSIHDVGLLNPVTIAAVGDGYVLVAGLHRLEACRSLGMEEVPAIMCGLDELRRGLAECDENLCRMLTPAERAIFTARRKELYEALHPETVNGANQHTRVRQIGEASEADRFTADTAVKTGTSERVVQRDAERGTKVCAEALSMLTGTHLDKGVYMDALKKLAPEEQVAKVEADLAAPVPVKRAAAPEPVTDESTGEPGAPAATADAQQPAPSPAPDDDEIDAEARREFRSLTKDGREDIWVEKCRIIVELCAERDEAKQERDALKATLSDMQSNDKDLLIRKLNEKLSAANYRRDQAMGDCKVEEAKRKRAEREKAVLQKRVDELQSMEIAL